VEQLSQEGRGSKITPVAAHVLNPLGVCLQASQLLCSHKNDRKQETRPLDSSQTPHSSNFMPLIPWCLRIRPRNACSTPNDTTIEKGNRKHLTPKESTHYFISRSSHENLIHTPRSVLKRGTGPVLGADIIHETNSTSGLVELGSLDVGGGILGSICDDEVAGDLHFLAIQ
jgi:hypothetical protein